MSKDRFADVILRAGLSFAFIFPAIDEIADPYAWIGYFPSFLRGFVPDVVLLHSFGAIEILIAVWLLSGWRIFLPSVMACVMLLSIVLFNRGDFQVLFRDLTIAAMALALAVRNVPSRARN